MMMVRKPKEPKILTSKRQFEIFKNEFTKWIRVFGIVGWEFHFEHTALEDARAEVGWDLLGRIATVRLSTDWGIDQPHDIMVRKCAFHEVLEVFLARISALATLRHVRRDEISEELHNIIRTLENIIFFEGNRNKIVS